MPRLYIRPATHVLNGTDIASRPTETAACHNGMPKGILIIIAMGDVKGIIDIHTDSDPDGSFSMAGIIIMVSRSGMVTGSENCCALVSLSTKAPIAAKSVP